MQGTTHHVCHPRRLSGPFIIKLITAIQMSYRKRRRSHPYISSLEEPMTVEEIKAYLARQAYLDEFITRQTTTRSRPDVLPTEDDK